MPCTILFADDEPAIRELVRATLKLMDCTLLEASTGEQAWELLQQYQPQVVLLDVKLPDLSGFELLQRIRNTPGLDGIRVIMLSGLTEDAAKQQGSALGVDAYMSKPFRPTALLEQIRQFGC